MIFQSAIQGTELASCLWLSLVVDDWYWVGNHKASYTGAAAIPNVLEDNE
jgi:hypothetical protein